MSDMYSAMHCVCGNLFMDRVIYINFVICYDKVICSKHFHQITLSHVRPKKKKTFVSGHIAKLIWAGRSEKVLFLNIYFSSKLVYTYPRYYLTVAHVLVFPIEKEAKQWINKPSGQ